MDGPSAKYVSYKVSKTRWRSVSHSSLQQPDVFATGSWDNENNKVAFWTINSHGVADVEDGFEGDPQLLCEQNHDGDVLDLQFLDHDRIVTASSTGAVSIFRHHQNSQTVSVSQCWQRAHRYPCDNAPCTAVVCCSPEIISVGEDGRIIIFRADQEGVVRVIEDADSSTIHAVTYVRTTEILTVNSIGQIKLWDFRQQSSSPSQILSPSGHRVPLYCVDRHPNQQHIVATGGQDGVLSVWDVRQGSAPISLMETHSAEMWEVHFHPTNPDHLFTCSEDGSLLHWETASHSDMPSFLQGKKKWRMMSRSATAPAGGNSPLVSAWLCGDSSKGRLETTHMLPSHTLSVNSLDVLGQCLVCGTDGEAIFVNRHVLV
ncbi:LOW QUALITY PROTEIN: nucleoporin Nup43 [Thalassophryne amazonica]|uniref:LOW QUALITY PROTEIN: nucleoporin Nup43 n=1 Tax=Thalassophryne amazonica TaxID=390379 RepID=UPI0014723E2F|nr:LOW QUALITY PROTEIN: nucleoporin Nup43 [Thalassophryne amazonica]